MIPALTIAGWQSAFPHGEGVAVMFDIFRCSTTIHTLVDRALGPVFVAPSLKAVQNESRLLSMRVFSELSLPVECKERFDNSPHEARTHAWIDEAPALVATTTGTPALFAAHNFSQVFVGSLVNFSNLVTHLKSLNCPVTLIPAAFPDSNHVEDEITAQAMATALEGFSNIPEFVQQCALAAKEKIFASGRPDHLAQKLKTGLADVTLAMEIDRLPQILTLEFENALFARVVKV